MCGLSRSVIVFQLFDWQICIYGKITLLFLFLDYFGLIRSIISTLVLFGPLWFLGKSVYYILFTLFDPIQSALVVPSLFGSLQSMIVCNVKIQDQAIHNEPRLTNVHDVKNNNELHNLYMNDLEIHWEDSLQSIPIKENSNFKKDRIGIIHT